MSKKLETILAGAVAAAVITAAALVFYHPNHSQAEFEIEKGESLLAIGRHLDARDLVISRYLFIGYAIFIGQEKNFKAGRYIIPPGTSIRQLVNLFAEGLAQPDDVMVTIPEGTNIADMEKILVNAKLIKPSELLTPANIEIAEGYLFPDTYRFRPDTNIGEILATLNTNFTQRVESLLVSKSQQEKGEIVIIASILEKEVKTEPDMRLVAGIIQKRLQLGMPLEIDATVAYGVCYPDFITGQYCDVSQVNLVDNIAVDSVYNTYQRRGLPAGPIGNPGLTAIRAALAPKSSDYLYYLTAKNGTTIFSKTAAEHSKARRKYLNL